MSNEWTTDEFVAAVDAYVEILNTEQSSEIVNKAEVRRKLLEGALRARSDSAIERRFRNISAVLESEGKERVAGYAPLGHIGPRGYKLIAEQLEARGLLGRDDYSPVDDTAELSVRAKRLMSRGKVLSPPNGQRSVRRVMRGQVSFVRDPRVHAYVLQVANGSCEYCCEPAPFLTALDEPYLEVHHVTPLSIGGPDTVDNAVALCPNCHRRAHHARDSESFRSELLRTVERLQFAP